MRLNGLRRALGDRGVANEPLSKHTTFRIGGPADLFVVARTPSELCEYVRLAWKHKTPYMVLGMGANVLVSDLGIRGLVIHNQSDAVEMEAKSGTEDWIVRAESGAGLASLARQTVARGLTGLEWAVDVPGTVGGAVVGNAGAFGGYVSDNLQGVTIFSPPDREHWLPASELGLGYRTSILRERALTDQTTSVVLSAVFALRAGDAEEIQERAAQFTQRRGETQPVGPSAGSVFKRTAQYPAGFLIENAGLKGTRIGDAVVSPQHANFIINLGGATAEDVRQLIELMRRTVYERYKVTLELEIQLVGEW